MLQPDSGAGPRLRGHFLRVEEQLVALLLCHPSQVPGGSGGTASVKGERATHADSSYSLPHPMLH